MIDAVPQKCPKARPLTIAGLPGKNVENDGIMQPSEIDIIAASVDKNDPKNDQDEEEQELFPNDEPKEPGDSSNPNEIDQSESNPDGSHFEINPVPYKVPNETSP